MQPRAEEHDGSSRNGVNSLEIVSSRVHLAAIEVLESRCGEDGVLRAVVCREYGSLDHLAVAEFDDPKPGPGEVLIGVRAAGLNFPDVLMVEGKYQFRPEPPFVPGGECAGEVLELGEGTRGLAVGDPVIGIGLAGAFAEKMVAPRAKVLSMPSGLTFAQAAASSVTYGTAHYALQHRAKLAEGETLLVLGAAGGVGTAAVELGKAMGAKVIAAASSPAKVEAALTAGADEGIDYRRGSLKDRVKELTGKAGADVIFDPVGGDYTEQAFRAIAWEGRFLVIGFAAGEIPRLPLNLALLKGADVRGVFWGSWLERDPEAAAASFAELHAHFESGILCPGVREIELPDFRRGFDLLAERKAVGKLVLTFD